MKPQQTAAAVMLLAVSVWAWAAMLFTHELGHVVAAYASGGRVTSLELRPGRLGHTLVAPNPRPSVVLWGGFAAGWLVPQAVASWWPARLCLTKTLLDAWAAFCWLAGGSYLAIAGGERFTDTGQLVAAGWPLPLLATIGIAAAAFGYARGRQAVKRLAEHLASNQVGWQYAACWWGWLIAWSAGQAAVHTTMQPG